MCVPNVIDNILFIIVKHESYINKYCCAEQEREKDNQTVIFLFNIFLITIDRFLSDVSL